MKTETKNIIRSIYIYFFSGLGTILLLVGIYQGVQFGVNKMVSPKYYLESYRETQCDTMYPPIMKAVPPTEQEVSASGDAAMMEKQKADCKVKLEEERRIAQVKDLSRSVTLIVLGILLVALHYPRTFREGI